MMRAPRNSKRVVSVARGRAKSDASTTLIADT